MKIKFGSKKHGVSTTVSTIFMVMVTVVAMLMVTSYSRTIIESRSAAMAERLTIEEAVFNATHVRLYVRNTGQTLITLEEINIDGVLQDLPQKILLSPRESNLYSEAEEIVIEGSFKEGNYVISFISSLNKDLGKREVQFSYKPRISIIEPTVGQKITDLTPRISAIVSDPSGVDDIILNGTIKLRLDQETLSPTISILDNFTILVSHELLPSEALLPTVTYHVVILDVADSMNNVASKTWWFELDNTPPSTVSIVGVKNMSSSELDVVWMMNPDLDIGHYSVYRSTSASGPFSRIANCTSNTTIYQDKGLAPGTYYYYKIRAVDLAGNEGQFSLVKAGKTLI